MYNFDVSLYIFFCRFSVRFLFGIIMRVISPNTGGYLHFLVASSLTYSLLRNRFFHEKDENADENVEREIP